MSELGKNFIAGGAGGMSAVLSGHPFDTIKVWNFIFFRNFIIFYRNYSYIEGNEKRV